LSRPLSHDDEQRIRALYEGRFDQFGHDVRTVGWATPDDQRLRFSVLTRDLPLDGSRILDVGCGLGDLVAFLDDGGCRNYEYVGIDISSKLIAEAQRCFGAPHRRFIVANLLDDPSLGSFDVVLCSGALSFRIADNAAVARRMIAEMFARCRHSTSVNFLSSYVDYQLPKNFHYEPETMFGYARSLTRWVRLHHDYPLYEFTLQLFRDANGLHDTP
jgi:SAM-dependent methyltransferase